MKKISGVIASALVCIGLAVAPGQASAGVTAIAPGCTASHPTAIGGNIYGYAGMYNNWTVSALVGIDLHDSAGNSVDADGNPHSGGYGYNDYVNPGLGQPGAASGGERTWGYSSTQPTGVAGPNGSLCVAANVTQAWLEVYPKGADGKTSYANYGGTMKHAWDLNVGATNTWGLRLPTGHEFGGNTGYLNGYLTVGGHKLTAAQQSATVIRVWSNQGPCGVFGFSGGDKIAPSSTQDATYYIIENLAGGQCGAASQAYRLFVTIPGHSTFERTFNVADGQGIRIDLGY